MVRLERQAGVAILVIDAPPVNALGAVVRTGLAAGLADAEADPEVMAVVIRGEGRMFSAGADISEFGKAPVAPLLSQVIVAVESMTKPVVAALHGSALGGGLELALGAHARVALAGASLGLPEVTLGILPGAGGTQRLPRLIGSGAALRMMLTGRPVSAAEALDLGLVDCLVEADLTASAVTLALDLARQGRHVPTRDRRDGMGDPAAYDAALQAARATADPRQPAQARIIACVAAARDLSFDEGLQMERAAFVDLVASPQAAALREAFREKRRLAREAVSSPVSGDGQTRP
jgi:3-hydroxyacyl-CoA dehydrogenase